MITFYLLNLYDASSRLLEKASVSLSKQTAVVMHTLIALILNSTMFKMATKFMGQSDCILLMPF